MTLGNRFPAAAALVAGLTICLAVAAVAVLLRTVPTPVAAQDVRYFRIGTGGTAGTYFQIGGIVANAISSPPGAPPCHAEGGCGVPGLIAVAETTGGSVANLEAIASGELESGFSQADIAYWAYHGTGVFRGKPAYSNLRTIANLYPEKVHVVVRADSDLHTIADLKGHRIALGPEGSGTYVDALIVLRAYGLQEHEVVGTHDTTGHAADLLRDDALDAFFIIGGEPVAAVADVANTVPIRLLPIDGPELLALQGAYSFFRSDAISGAVYEGVPLTPTVSVGAQFVVPAELDPDLVHAITEALWSPRTMQLLRDGHPKGALITLETATQGLGVPLHDGARRYYVEQGVLDQQAAR